MEDDITMEHDLKMLELWDELKSKFHQSKSHQVFYCDDILVYVTIYDKVRMEFHRSSEDYSFQYDILENYKILEEFLVFNNHKITSYRGLCCFLGKYTKIVIYWSDIRLSILKDDGEFDHIDFTKIYDLIDYLKDYFKIQNKVAFEE